MMRSKNSTIPLKVIIGRLEQYDPGQALLKPGYEKTSGLEAIMADSYHSTCYWRLLH